MGRVLCSYPRKQQRPTAQTEGTGVPARDAEGERGPEQSGQHSSLRRRMYLMVELNWNKMG